MWYEYPRPIRQSDIIALRVAYARTLPRSQQLMIRKGNDALRAAEKLRYGRS